MNKILSPCAKEQNLNKGIVVVQLDSVIPGSNSYSSQDKTSFIYSCLWLYLLDFLIKDEIHLPLYTQLYNRCPSLKENRQWTKGTGRLTAGKSIPLKAKHTAFLLKCVMDMLKGIYSPRSQCFKNTCCVKMFLKRDGLH